jgi:steroid delta-isomerase-like uncharacterized protein
MSREFEEIKTKVIRANHAAWNEGELDALDEIYSPDLVRHEPPFPEKPDLATYKQWIADSRVSYPDAKLNIDEMIIVGDKVASKWTFTGTHSGSHTALPIPPSNKFVEMKGASFAHMKGDLMTEEWIYGDYMGLFQQIGVIPAFEAEDT